MSRAAGEANAFESGVTADSDRHQDADRVVGQAPDVHRQARPGGAGARRGRAGVGHRRQGVPRLHRRHRGDRARPQPSQGGRAPCASRPRPCSTSPTSSTSRQQTQLAKLLCDHSFARPGVLLQLGRGGQRGRDQARAQVGQGARGQRPRRHHHDARRLPRPHARHRRPPPPRRSTTTASSRCPAGSSTCRSTTCARWSGRSTATPRRCWSSRSRARAGSTSRTTATCPVSASSATRPASSWSRRDPDRHGPHRPAVGLRALRDRAGHHDAGQGARQRRARSGPRSPPRSVAPASDPRHPRLDLRRQPVRHRGRA